MTSTFTPEELRDAAELLSRLSVSEERHKAKTTQGTNFFTHSLYLSRIAEAIEEENKPKIPKIAYRTNPDGGIAVYLEIPGTDKTFAVSTNGESYNHNILTGSPECWGTLINTESN